MNTPTATVAAYDLRAIREQWGDLLAAIGRPPRAEWPPRDSRALGAVAEPDDEPAVGRLPLVLREHPAPANLTALDAAVSVEQALFTACDAIAAAVQRPIRRRRVALRSTPPRTVIREDQADRDDPARWHYPAPTSPGSRAYGLHWAAVWLEGRALDEQSGDLFRPLPEPVLVDLATVARRARARVETALGRDGRPTVLDRPCPYCRGRLTAHTRTGDPMAATIVCSTGEPCPAPVLLDHGRRTWTGADLVTLYVALESAHR
ncbi:hypothetical protein [Streptomyces sp. ML-6]|uniref:hypothetical protein n=1 Tax=Streptomyces sp. ML-6 TaxID=2982693 RepID=UPI0024BFC1B6|nr:hypothetical protein [Streptomyces sp. ML-6]MDK0520372.1 hypothetical protein [Streptomyces sp. ML-6]